MKLYQPFVAIRIIEVKIKLMLGNPITFKIIAVRLKGVDGEHVTVYFQEKENGELAFTWENRVQINGVERKEITLNSCYFRLQSFFKMSLLLKKDKNPKISRVCVTLYVFGAVYLDSFPGKQVNISLLQKYITQPRASPTNTLNLKNMLSQKIITFSYIKRQYRYSTSNSNL